MFRILGLITVAFWIAAPALAGTLTAVQVIERRTLVKTADGGTEIQYVPVERAAPGDVLRYTTVFDNQGSEAATDIVLAVPVPDVVTYLEGSASLGEAVVEFSADGAKTFARREQLTVKDQNGVRRAAAGDITHVRWSLTRPLLPGEKGRVGFEAVLD